MRLNCYVHVHVPVYSYFSIALFKKKKSNFKIKTYRLSNTIIHVQVYVSGLNIHLCSIKYEILWEFTSLYINKADFC